MLKFSTLSSLVSSLTIAGRIFTWERYFSVYFICSSIQARVAGDFPSSSQRYGSVIEIPWMSSTTGWVAVTGGGGRTIPLPPLMCEGLSAAKANEKEKEKSASIRKDRTA